MKSKKKISTFIYPFLNKPKTTGFFVFLIFSFISFYIITQQYHIAKENLKTEMHRTLEHIHLDIDKSLKYNYTTALTLALTINDKGEPENFDTIAKKLLESNENIDAVQLVPNGIIKYTYPIKGNEAALGLNILTSKEHQFEALQSIKTQKMYYAGPLELRQGGLGIVGRLPIYKKNKFWGFSAVIIKMKTLLKSLNIQNIDNSKYYFQISKINPLTHKEDFFLPTDKNLSLKNSVSIIIPDGNWKLYLIDRKPIDLYIPIIFFGFIGLLIACLLGFLTTSFLKKPAELQSVIEQKDIDLSNTQIKFKTLFDQAAVGIAYIDSKTLKVIDANKKYCDLSGYSLHEIEQQSLQTVIHPNDLQKCLINFEKIIRGEVKEYSAESRYLPKSGNYIWIKRTVFPLWKINETPTTFIAIIEDISEKKKTEKLLQKSKLRFKSLFDYSPVALWEADYSDVKKYLEEQNLIDESPENIISYLENHPEVLQKCFTLVKILDVNIECLSMYKPLTKTELLSQNNKLLSKEEIPGFTKLIVAICSKINNLKINYKAPSQFGGTRYFNLIYSVIKGHEDTLKRVIISTEDISERKLAEKTILDSQQRIESLINTIDGIVWECDAKTIEFHFISKKVENILGYTSEEWLASPTFWQDHIHPDDRDVSLNFCAERTNLNLDHDFEYRMIAKNGEIVWLRDIVNVISENGKAKSLRGIMIDVTKNKEIEKNLHDSFNLVSEQNKRLLNFSYIVSHNLRSHTSNILSIVDLIETSESEEEKVEMIQLLKSVSDSLNETMLNLNEVVNIQTNVGLVKQSLNLKKYLDNTLKILSDQIEMKGIKIISSIKEDVEINYSPAYLESILYNLISNAVRYSHTEINPIISIDYYTGNNMNVLQISDNGIGIDLKKNGHKIFGMYKKFSTHRDSKGIGLFITKNQIDAMGGNITVESEPNMGTTFKIYIA